MVPIPESSSVQKTTTRHQKCGVNLRFPSPLTPSSACVKFSTGFTTHSGTCHRHILKVTTSSPRLPRYPKSIETVPIKALDVQVHAEKGILGTHPLSLFNNDLHYLQLVDVVHLVVLPVRQVHGQWTQLELPDISHGNTTSDEPAKPARDTKYCPNRNKNSQAPAFPSHIPVASFLECENKEIT